MQLTSNLPPPYPHGPAQHYKQRNTGLYGNAKIQYGNKVSERNEVKTRRVWRPNIHRKRLWSDALQKFIQLKVQARVLRTIDKVGGLDEYLLGEKSARIKELGVAGWALRWRIMQTKAVMERLGRRREEVGVPAEGFEERARLEKENALKEARRMATEYVVLKEQVDGERNKSAQIEIELDELGRQIWLDAQAASMPSSLPASMAEEVPESAPTNSQRLGQLYQTLEHLASQCELAVPTLLANARTTLDSKLRAEAKAKAHAQLSEGSASARSKAVPRGPGRERRSRKAATSTRTEKMKPTDPNSGKEAQRTPSGKANDPEVYKRKGEVRDIQKTTTAYKKGGEYGVAFWTWYNRTLAKVSGLFGRRR